MRAFVFVLSAMAGVVFFWLLAKVLFFGLALFLVVGLMAAAFRKLRGGRGMGYHPAFDRRHDFGAYRREAEPLPWTVYRREAEPLADYRLIQVN